MSECLLCVVLAQAGWTDWKQRRVYNLLLLAGAASGVCCRGWRFLPAAGTALLPGYLLFRLGMIGAGDGKLAALIVGWLGWERGIWAVGAGLLAGGFWSLHCLWWGGGLRARLEYLHAYIMRIFSTGRIEAYGKLPGEGKEQGVPLAACLAAGTMAYLILCRVG